MHLLAKLPSPVTPNQSGDSVEPFLGSKESSETLAHLLSERITGFPLFFPATISAERACEQFHVLQMRNLERAERGEVRVHDLGIEYRKARFAAMVDQGTERNLRGIGLAVKHRFRAEARAKSDAVNPAAKLIALPRFSAMGPSLAEDLAIDADEMFADPVVARPEAATHNVFEACVESDFKDFRAYCLSERARDADSAQGK